MAAPVDPRKRKDNALLRNARVAIERAYQDADGRDAIAVTLRHAQVLALLRLLKE